MGERRHRHGHRHDDEFEDDRAAPTPRVVGWYRVYLAGLALFSLAIFAVAAFLWTVPAQPGKPGDQAVKYFVVAVYVLGGVLCLASGVIPLLLPRRPWAWVVHLVVICLGLTGGCTIIPCVFLLIYWLKPETKRYFGFD